MTKTVTDAQVATPGRPTPRIGGVWIFIVGWAVIGIVFFVSGLVIGGGYLGRSGQTTATVVAVNNDRPVVRYTVDGTTYEHSTTEHGPWFTVGQQVTLMYNPDHPASAETTGSRTTFLVFVLVGGAFLVVAAVHLTWVLRRHRRQRAAVAHGRLVDAAITGSHANAAAHINTKILWYVTCVWTDQMNNREHTYTSGAVWSSCDPVLALRAAKVTTLPVYVDPLAPDKRYYVDDRPIKAAIHS